MLKSLKLKKTNRKKLKITVAEQKTDAEPSQVVHKNSKYEKAKEKTKSLWNRSKIMKGLNSLNLKKKQKKQEKFSTMKVIAMINQDSDDDDEEFFQDESLFIQKGQDNLAL